MTQWVRGFVITDVVAVHEEFQACIKTAERLTSLERETKKDLGATRTLADLRAAYDTFNMNLKLVATRGAESAMKGMVERLQATQRRPESGSVPPMKDLVLAAPLGPVGKLQSGAVGVASIELLNRAINPHSRGYGPYWRALEYGTGQEGVPSQVGRILFGSFTGPGGADPTRPMAEFGGGGGPHPVFISRGVGGEPGAAGFGTIQHEVEAKHFIRFGADGAAVKWRQDVNQVQNRALTELRGIKLAGS